jgi:chromosome segregation ATPase
VRKFLIVLAFIAATPLFAGQGVIKTLQKRIKKDRKDILLYMTEIKDLQAQLKKDKAKAAKYSDQADTEPVAEASPQTVDGPTPVPSKADKWNSRVAKENASIASDKALQEKAQKDLAQANTQLSDILAKH